MREILDKAIHSLARRPVHDDVDSDAQIRSDNFGIAAKQTVHLLLRQGVWDLWKSYQCQLSLANKQMRDC